MLRKVAGSAAFAFVALVTLPAAVSQAHPAASTAPAAAITTSVVHLSPVSKSGKVKAGYSVQKSFSAASCEFGSEVTGSAYRCFAGKTNHSLNKVIDPCWVEHVKRYVACLSSPSSFNLVELTVTKKFHNAGYSKKASKLPWGVQLGNGIQCGLIPSMAPVFHGRPVHYACPASAKIALYGNVNSSSKTWTIRQATVHGGHFTKDGRAQLSTAWFGKASRKG